MGTAWTRWRQRRGTQVDDPPCDNIKTVLEGSLVVVSLDNEKQDSPDDSSLSCSGDSNDHHILPSIAEESGGSVSGELSDPFDQSKEENAPSNQLKEARERKAQAASDTLQCHFHQLIPIMNPELVARALFAKKIITTELMKEMGNSNMIDEKRAEKLLLDLIAKVRARLEWFEDVCQALEEASVPGVDDLRAEYRSRCGDQPRSKHSCSNHQSGPDDTAIHESEEPAAEQSVVTHPVVSIDSIVLEVEAAYRKGGVAAVQSIIEPFSSQNELLKAILMALVNRNPELPDVVQLLLTSGVPAHFSLNRWTPLQCASKNGQWTVVRLLVQHKQGLYECCSTEEGKTLLHLAGQNGHNDVINVLLSECDPAKLGINSMDKQGNTPLLVVCGRAKERILDENHGLIQLKLEEIVSNLLKYGAKVDLKNQDGETALHLSCHNVRILRILLGFAPLAQGCIDIKDKNGNTALHIACSFEREYSMVKELLEHRPHLHFQNKEQDTPLHLACRAGNAEVAVLLVRYDPAALDGLDKDYNNVLHLAITLRNPDFVKKLIEVVDPESDVLLRNLKKENKNGFSPLHLACRETHPTIVGIFMKCKGFSPNFRNKDGYTPLHTACEQGSVDTVQKLVEGCPRKETKLFLDDCAITNHDTAMHLASRAGHLSVVKILKGHKASKRIKNKQEMVPAEVAKQYGHQDICDYLKGRRSRLSSRLNRPSLRRSLSSNSFNTHRSGSSLSLCSFHSEKLQ